MPPITLQQLITFALPLLAMLVSYGLQQAHYPAAINTAIAAGTVIAAAVADVFIQGKLTGNLYADLLLIAGAATALQAEALAPLQQYLRENFPRSTAAKQGGEQDPTH